MAKKPSSFGKIGGSLPPFDPKEFAKVQSRSKAMAAAPAKPKPKPAPKAKIEGLKTRRNRANALAERGLDAL